MTRLAYVCEDPGIPLAGTKGSSIHLRSMVEAFVRSGARVTLLTPREEEAPWTREAGVQVVRLDRNLRSKLQTFNALERAHLTRGFDAVYERLSLFAEGASRWCRFYGVPHWVEVNAPLADETALHRGLAEASAAGEAERAVLRNADLLLPVSPWLARWLRERVGAAGRLELMPNGVNEELLARGTASIANAGGATCLGFVGSLRPWHDLETVLNAAELLPAERYALWIVGDGPAGERLRARLKHPKLARMTTWGGAIPSERVPEMIDGMDFCLAPYAAEGDFYFCPIKMFEYGARRKPVIAANREELREQFPEGSIAWYRAGDAASLAETIERLAGDARQADALAASLNGFVAGHTWDAHAAQILEMGLDAGRGRARGGARS